MLAGHETDYRTWKAAGKPGDDPTFTLGKRFTQLRNAPGHEWLKDYSYEIVRYTCKYMGDAYAAYLRRRRHQPPSTTSPAKGRIHSR